MIHLDYLGDNEALRPLVVWMAVWVDMAVWVGCGGRIRGEVAREIVRDTGARGGLKQRGPTWEAASWVGDPPETFWSRALAASGSPSLPTGSGAG